MSQCNQSPNIRIERIRDNLQNRQTPNKHGSPNNGAQKNQLTRNDSAMLAPEDMTDVLGNTTAPSNSAIPPATVPGRSPATETDIILPDAPGGPVEVLPNAPIFKVPANPLLPPEYQEVLNYNDLQYANGFFRTQIGRYVKVECLVGSNEIVVKYGYLIGVGLNYILLQEAVTGNVLSVDFWSIKFMYIYYNKQDLKRVMPFVEEEQ